MLETYTAACGCVVNMKLHTGSAGVQDIHTVWVSKRCDGAATNISPVTVVSVPSGDTPPIKFIPISECPT